MIVRPAGLRDMPTIIEMGERFFVTTEYTAFSGYDELSADAIGRMLIEHGVLLVAEVGDRVVGMVGLMVAPFLFNHSLKTAHEVMWWVDEDMRDKGAGIALLRAVEPACRGKGAVAIQMIHLSNSPPQASALYERLGFGHSESSYTKVL